MRQADKTWEIPLWETNHSKQRLLQEEAMDFLSYKLGYEMSEETDDPTKKAYKHFDGYLKSGDKLQEIIQKFEKNNYKISKIDKENILAIKH